MTTHPPRLGAEAARARLVARAAPALLDRRLHALAGLLALLAGLLLGGGEADAAVRHNPRTWGR